MIRARGGPGPAAQRGSMRVLVTGGAGFIGSHVAAFYAQAGHEVVVLDNLSRARLLHRDGRHARHNWDFLGTLPGVRLVEGDVRDRKSVRPLAHDADLLVHAAGQTAVTTSVTDPAEDFDVNAGGTLSVLEAVRDAPPKTIVYCSTNKVYGDNVNTAGVVEEPTRYRLGGRFAGGIPETFPVDGCKHTPYGCSKLAADLYMQDWARLYGHRVGVFRMSCIYGTRQFGVEDQGWIAWFARAALTRRPITLFGDGKQLRDVLYVDDLVRCYDAFVRGRLPHGVFNTGGGPGFTLSLLELIEGLERRLGRKLEVVHRDWRPSDQKVYVSDITRLCDELGWQPRVPPDEGIDRVVAWAARQAW